MGSGWEEKVGGFETDRRGRKKVRGLSSRICESVCG